MRKKKNIVIYTEGFYFHTSAFIQENVCKKYNEF